MNTISYKAKGSILFNSTKESSFDFVVLDFKEVADYIGVGQ
jgi:hypothetical protein